MQLNSEHPNLYESVLLINQPKRHITGILWYQIYILKSLIGGASG